jgi:hypothetical protein
MTGRSCVGLRSEMDARLRQLPRQGSKHGIASAWSGSSRRARLSPGKLALYSRTNRGNPAQGGSMSAWMRSQSVRVEPPSKWVSSRDLSGAGAGRCGAPQGVTCAVNPRRSGSLSVRAACRDCQVRPGRRRRGSMSGEIPTTDPQCMDGFAPADSHSGGHGPPPIAADRVSAPGRPQRWRA